MDAFTYATLGMAAVALSLLAKQRMKFSSADVGVLILIGLAWPLYAMFCVVAAVVIILEEVRG
jgi:hypothetical protein